MKFAINTNNIAKIKLIESKPSDKYRWFNNPKGMLFRKPSGIYFTFDNEPIDLIAKTYEDAVEIFDESKYKINKNLDGSLNIIKNAFVKIWYVGIEDPFNYYYETDDEAKQFYYDVCTALKNKIIYEN